MRHLFIAYRVSTYLQAVHSDDFSLKAILLFVANLSPGKLLVVFSFVIWFRSKAFLSWILFMSLMILHFVNLNCPQDSDCILDPHMKKIVCWYIICSDSSLATYELIIILW